MLWPVTRTPKMTDYFIPTAWILCNRFVIENLKENEKWLQMHFHRLEVA